MILSDKDIREHLKNGKIKVEPCKLQEQLGTVGIDLRLSNEFRIFKTTHKPFIDLSEGSMDLDTEQLFIKKGEKFVLHPGEFVLGVTLEHIELPNDIAARLDGRSSLGRLGIIVHSTAGHIDPGWKGRLTLEISNIGKLPIALVPEMRFCHLMFEQVSTPVEKTYHGKYFGNESPTASKIGQDFSSK
jgi:dCTP deaminase